MFLIFNYVKAQLTAAAGFIAGAAEVFTQAAGHDGMHGTVQVSEQHTTADYIIIWVGIIIVLITLVLSIKFLVKPNEDDPKHIKNIVKNEGF